MDVFELCGGPEDESRLLRHRATGYSVTLPGRPALVPVPDGDAHDAALVTLRDVNAELGFRIVKISSGMDPTALAQTLAIEYASGRASTPPRLEPIAPSLRPGTSGGARSLYPLRDAADPTMEQLWVVLRAALDGFWALYYTARFRTADVDLFQWAHLAAALADQHHWDPHQQRTTAAPVWADCEITRPSAKLDLTEAGWAEAVAKSKDVSSIDGEQMLALTHILRELVQTDEPPRRAVNATSLRILTRRIAMCGPTQAVQALLRNLEQCKTQQDLRGWAWQCVWSMGHRAAPAAP